jgi:hypothetical protein
MTKYFAASLLASAAFAGTAQAAAILMIGNGADSNYTSFLTGLGHTVTFKANGGSSEQIGGDLDGTRVIGGVSQTQKAYLNSFDTVIVLRNSGSSNFTEPLDWASVTAKVLVHNTFVARGSRLGMWGGDGGTFDLLTSSLPVDETAIPAGAQSSPIFAGVTISGNAADLIDGTEFDGLIESPTPVIAGGTGSIYGRSNGTISGNSYINMVYLAPGTAVYNGSSLTSTLTASNRLYFGFGDADNFAGLTAGGERVIQNFIAIPEPATLGLLAMGGLMGLRRRRTA